MNIYPNYDEDDYRPSYSSRPLVFFQLHEIATTTDSSNNRVQAGPMIKLATNAVRFMVAVAGDCKCERCQSYRDLGEMLVQ